jgi:hypothetical protein
MPARILRQSDRDVPKGETMKRAKSILYGATALAIVAGSATANIAFADTPSDIMSMDDSTAGASTIYPVDEDRDGRADRLLILEQSDSLA